MSKFIRAKETGLIAVILVLGGLLALFGGSVKLRQRDPSNPGVVREVIVNKFLQPRNLGDVLKNCSWIAVMAVGATVLIVAGGIDLSIGASYCLAAVAGAMVLSVLGPNRFQEAIPIWVIPLGIVTSLAVGGLCGFANGLMVVLLRVHPFIITLGTMTIFRGVAFKLTAGQPVTDYPPGFGAAFRHTAYDVTLLPIAVVIGVAAIGYVYLKHTVSGRNAYAVGGNELASEFSGLRVSRIKLGVFTLAGLTAGVAAVISLGVFGSADSSTGRGYELDVIAAAVVGGASLSGGRGTALGAVLGAVVIQLISNGIVILGIDQSYAEIIKGGVIILAVVLDRFSTSLGERRLTRV